MENAPKKLQAALLKVLFHPICHTLIMMGAYLSLSMFLYVEFDRVAFKYALIIAGLLPIIIYFRYLRKQNCLTEKQHFIFSLACIGILFLLLLFYAAEIKRSDITFQIIALASITPFYHFCGYARFTKVTSETSLLNHIFGILLVPFAAFLIFNFYMGANYKTIYVIVMVAAYYFVIFSLVKIFALAVKDKKQLLGLPTVFKTSTLTTLFVAILLPVTGLLLNQYMYSFVNKFAEYTYHYSSRYSADAKGFFGDFSHPAFYLLVILNGLTLLIPISRLKWLRLPLFFLRSVGYSFVCYMCLVFLPVLPMGVYTLVFIIGFYAFLPLVLTLRQGKELRRNYHYLSFIYNKFIVGSIFVIGFLVLPTLLAWVFAYDKENYEKALTYAALYNTNSSIEIDIAALERTVASRSASSSAARLYHFKIWPHYSFGNTPLISGAYKLYVYGGKERDINWELDRRMRALFFNGHYGGYMHDAYDLSILDHHNRLMQTVEISGIKHNSVYDDNIEAWRTWVDITLQNGDYRFNEYKTVFYLPEGAFISDYYLYVEDEKKMGLLTDRRAALAIYKKIVLSKLDPGVLHYIDDNMLELRVFPFAPDEERKTGFEILHKNPISFEIGGHEITAGKGKSLTDTRLEHVVLLSADEIKNLPPIERQQAYHFIIDASKNSDIKQLAANIINYCETQGIQDGTLYLTTYRLSTHPLSYIHELAQHGARAEGGFNLNLAVREIIKNSTPDSIPIIIFVTEGEEDIIFAPEPIKDHAAPDLTFYYRLNSNKYRPATLTPYSLLTNFKLRDVSKPITSNVVSYEGRAVINDGTDKIVIFEDKKSTPTGNQYLDALALAAEYQMHLKNTHKPPVSYIQKSLIAHVLTPATAFIVVETQEQEDELLALQEQFLNDDPAEERRALSEPPMVVMLAMMVIFGVFAKRYRF